MERVVDVQVDREQRLVAHRVQFVVELLVLLLGDVGGLAGPQRLDVVDDVVLVRVDVLAVLPLLDLAESDGHGQEAAVFLQQFADFRLLGILQRIFREVQHDGRAAVASLVGLLHLELGGSGAAPMHGLGPLAERFGEYLDLVRHHERRVESQSEVADDGLILILLHELLGTRECDLVDVLVHLLGRHAHAAVRHGQRLLLLVRGHMDGQVAQIALHFADRRKGLQLLGGIHGVRDQLAQEDFMLRIEEFLDDGEDVLRRDSDFSVFHSLIVVVLLIFQRYSQQTVCQRFFPAILSAGTAKTGQSLAHRHAFSYICRRKTPVSERRTVPGFGTQSAHPA